MKKILLTMAAITTISNFAFAEEKKCCHLRNVAHNPIYLRVDLLGEKFHKTFSNQQQYKQSKHSYGLDVGLGYYVMSPLRLEAVYNHNFITKLKGNESTRNKVDTKAFFIRAMVDIINAEKIKVFGGVGIGGARVHHKLHDDIRNTKSSAKYNLAYSYHAGAAIDLVEGVMLEAGWSRRDYGKTGNIKDVEGTKLKLRTQIVSLGLRFDV